MMVFDNSLLITLIIPSTLAAEMISLIPNPFTSTYTSMFAPSVRCIWVENPSGMTITTRISAASASLIASSTVCAVKSDSLTPGVFPRIVVNMSENCPVSRFMRAISVSFSADSMPALNKSPMAGNMSRGTKTMPRTILGSLSKSFISLMRMVMNLLMGDRLQENFFQVLGRVLVL